MLRTRIRFVPALIAGLLLVTSAYAQDKIAEYRQRYDHESDPVRKAKDFQQLGDAQIAEFVRATVQDRYDVALTNLSDYRLEAHTCFDGLAAAVPDAEKHPEGYRQLQIHIRKGLWEMERTIPSIPDGRRQDFRAIHDDLAELQTKLIHVLFPRDTTAPKDKGKGH